MKTIIAGSRDINDMFILLTAIHKGVKLGRIKRITEVVSGTARGVDRLGEQFAAKFRIPLATFPADWGTYGRVAGVIRNGEMADYADQLVAIWDGVSRGTKDMIDRASSVGLNVYVFNLEKEAGKLAMYIGDKKNYAR